MVSELGKLLRKWRIDKGVTMKEMADSIGVSTAFLSSIELNKKKISKEVRVKVLRYFDLNQEDVEHLDDAIAKSVGYAQISLNNLNSKDQDGVLAFARKYSDLSDTQKEKIRRMLGE